MFAGKVHDLRHFGLRDLVGEYPAFTDPMLMHMHHDPVRRLMILVEETFEHVNHELHRRVVIVEQQDTVEVWALRLRPRFSDDRSPRPTLIALPFAFVVRHAGGHADIEIVTRHCLRLSSRPVSAGSAVTLRFIKASILPARHTLS